MKKLLLLLIAIQCSMFNGQWSKACTNFIVGKKASVDGSVFVTYNADSYGAFMPLYHYPAAKHQAGDMRQVYEWDTNKYLGEIAEAPETYNVIGNSNEWQVTIGETTFGGREEMADSTGVIDYGSLIYIALQRSISLVRCARSLSGTPTSIWVRFLRPQRPIMSLVTQTSGR